MFPINSTSEQKVLISLNPVTAAGNPATLDGAPVWSVIEGDCTLVREISELIIYSVVAPEATALGVTGAVENK